MAWWSFNAHDPHEPTDSATSNAMAQFVEFISQLALPKKGTFYVNFVDEALELLLPGADFRRGNVVIFGDLKAPISEF
jgi:hypothetical protein